MANGNLIQLLHLRERGGGSGCRRLISSPSFRMISLKFLAVYVMRNLSDQLQKFHNITITTMKLLPLQVPIVMHMINEELEVFKNWGGGGGGWL